VIYICCSNNDISKYWKNNIKATTPMSILDNETDIFNQLIAPNDIVILDIDIFKDVREVLLFISSLPKTLKVITIKNNLNLAEGTLLIKKGVKSYCSSSIGRVVLRRMIKTVEVGDTWVYPALMTYIIKNVNVNPQSSPDEILLDKLSKKEKNIALLVASGTANKEIAQTLGVALVTVKKHISKIFEKLDVKDRVSLSILINK